MLLAAHTPSLSLDLPLTMGQVALLSPADEDLAQARWRAWFNPGYRRVWQAILNEPRPNRTHSMRLFLHRAVGFRLVGGSVDIEGRPSLDTSRLCVRPKDGNYLNCMRENLHVYFRGPTRPEFAGIAPLPAVVWRAPFDPSVLVYG